VARRKLIAGNWKMVGTTAENQARVEAILAALTINQVEWALLPAFVHLTQVAALLKQLPQGFAVRLGAQHVSEQPGPGAFTGEVSALMLKDIGVHYVLIGHSERRSLYGVTDAVTLAQFQAAKAAGLTPILCVGETRAEREAGRTEAVIARQLSAVLDTVKAEGWGDALIAYEPVWAIGTGLAASVEQASQVHQFIRSRLRSVGDIMGDSVRILYGGSVKPANAKELFSVADIDGGLIGGAALNAADFLAIGAAASPSG